MTVFLVVIAVTAAKASEGVVASPLEAMRATEGMRAIKAQVWQAFLENQERREWLKQRYEALLKDQPEARDHSTIVLTLETVGRRSAKDMYDLGEALRLRGLLQAGKEEVGPDPSRMTDGRVGPTADSSSDTQPRQRGSDPGDSASSWESEEAVVSHLEGEGQSDQEDDVLPADEQPDGAERLLWGLFVFFVASHVFAYYRLKAWARRQELWRELRRQQRRQLRRQLKGQQHRQ